QGRRSGGPGDRAHHGRHQGNRRGSGALLDRHPLHRSAERHGHEPAEQQGGLLAVRGHGRARLAGRYSGDARGPIRGEEGMNRAKALFVGVVAFLLSARPVDRQAAALPACDPDNGGITLPAGFCAVVVADQVGAPRHLAVAPNGDLFVALQSRPGGVLALRDTTGIRKAVGLAFAPSGELYATQHGRDQLGQNWPKLFTLEQSAEKPSEEFFKLSQGNDYGWPYCYHDPELGHLVLAPEYGGDGKTV